MHGKAATRNRLPGETRNRTAATTPAPKAPPLPRADTVAVAVGCFLDAEYRGRYRRARIASDFGTAVPTVDKWLAGLRRPAPEIFDRMVRRWGHRFLAAVYPDVLVEPVLEQAWSTDRRIKDADDAAGVVGQSIGLTPSGRDLVRYATRNLGWILLGRTGDALTVRLDGLGAEASAQSRACQWLRARSALGLPVRLIIDGEAGGSAERIMTVADAIRTLQHLAAPARLSSGDLAASGPAWQADRKPLAAMTHPLHQRTLGAWREAEGAYRPFRTALAAAGLMENAAMLLVCGDDVTSLWVGSSLGVDVSVVGLNVLARRDRDYGQMIHAHALAIAESPEPVAHRLYGIAIGDHTFTYSRLACPFNHDDGQSLVVTTVVIEVRDGERYEPAAQLGL